MNHMTASLAELAAAYTEDGELSAGEVRNLRERLFADRTIDSDEINVVFGINDKVSGNTKNHPTWPALFADVLSAYYLADGKVTQEESDELFTRISANGSVDAPERVALYTILNSGAQMPTSFREKATKLLNG